MPNSQNGSIILTDGSSQNYVRIYFNKDAGDQLLLRVRASGTIVSHVVPSGDINFEDYNKIAIKYKSNDVSFWLNGVKVGENFSLASPIGLSKLSFNSNGTVPFFGNTKDVKVYPKALSDVELETLTSWSSFREMAEAQSYIVE